jgi:hypothetical protein
VTDVEDFTDLVGCELGTVCFVRNYVELDFDGPVLRSLAPPSVIADEATTKFGEAGSRDALCELIGETVSSADDLPTSLRLGFENGKVFEIPKASSDVGAEIAHFVPMQDGARVVSNMSIWENLISTY